MPGCTRGGKEDSVTVFLYGDYYLHARVILLGKGNFVLQALTTHLPPPHPPPPRRGVTTLSISEAGLPAARWCGSLLLQNFSVYVFASPPV